MADQFITDLAAATGISLTDLLPLEQGVGGTPITRKASYDLLLDMAWQYRHVITPVVATNNLTVSIKDQAGADASASNPISFRVGNTRYDLAASASFTKGAGTNWCNLGSAELVAKATDLFMYAIGETGASAGLKFGFSRIPYARTMADFVNTTTSEKYIAGNWTNFNATDPVANIGRFRAQLSAAAAYNWSIASSVVVNYPIYESDWLAYTPVPSSSVGTVTTFGAVSGNYRVIGRDFLFDHSAAITTNGTGAGALKITLPFTPAAGFQIGAGRENAVTGLMLQSQLAGNYASYVTYANGYPGGSGYVVLGSGLSKL